MGSILRALQESSSSSGGLATWIIVVISVGCGIAAILFLGVLIYFVRRHKKQKNRRLLEKKMFAHEREKAERMLIELKRANLQKERANQPQYASPPPEPCLCDPYGSYPPYPPQPGYGEPYADPYAYSSSPPPMYPPHAPDYGYEEEEERHGPRMRQAQNYDELPTTQAPVPPPGFVTVPMVIEED